MLRLSMLSSAYLLLGALVSTPVSAADLDLREDGWYRWEVAAGADGLKTCCYEVRAGAVQRVACRLGDGMNEFLPSDDCELRSDAMQIFVNVHDGRVREIRSLSSACPVRTGSEVHTIEGVTTAQSIAWLRLQVDENPRVAEDAIMTLSFHAEHEGLGALFDILEDTAQRQDAREQALFWLIQSDSDEAYAYLDRLLD